VLIGWVFRRERRRGVDRLGIQEREDGVLIGWVFRREKTG
jgi:hypothetical protein